MPLRASRWRSLLPPLSLLIVWCPVARAEPSPSAQAPEEALPASLSLADAEQRFAAHGFDVSISQAGVKGAEGDLRAAQAHPNPGLSLSPQFTPAMRHDLLYRVGQNVPVPVWGVGIALSDNAGLEDLWSGKRSLRIDAASKALDAAHFDLEDVKRVGLAQVREAYVLAVMARMNVDSAQQAVDTYDQQLKWIQARHDSGEANGLDLVRIQQAQLESLQALDQARAGQAQALSALRFLLGAGGTQAPLTLTTGLGYAALPPLDHATEASLVSGALAARSDVKRAQAKWEQTRIAVEQAKRARIPEISLSLGYSEQCSAASCSSEPAFTLGLQGDLPIFYQQQGEVGRAQGDALAAARTVEKVQAQAALEVAQAWAAYTAAKRQVERMEGGLFAQARRSRDLAELMYRKGAASLLDYLDAERAFLSSQLEYHQNLAGYWSAVFQLEQASATPLPGPEATSSEGTP